MRCRFFLLHLDEVPHLSNTNTCTTHLVREILNAEVEDREAIPYDEDYYAELASQYASNSAKEKKMAPEW